MFQLKNLRVFLEENLRGVFHEGSLSGVYHEESLKRERKEKREEGEGERAVYIIGQQLRIFGLSEN